MFDLWVQDHEVGRVHISFTETKSCRCDNQQLWLHAFLTSSHPGQTGFVTESDVTENTWTSHPHTPTPTPISHWQHWYRRHCLYTKQNSTQTTCYQMSLLLSTTQAKRNAWRACTHSSTQREIRERETCHFFFFFNAHMQKVRGWKDIAYCVCKWRSDYSPLSVSGKTVMQQKERKNTVVLITAYLRIGSSLIIP